MEYAADRPGDDPSELYDIREYRAGDRISRIHWKLSERGEEVYVKEGGLPLDQSPFLAVDPARADDDRAETVLTEAFSLSRHFAFSGVCHRLGILLGQGAEAPSVFSIENPEDFYLALRAVLSARRTGAKSRISFFARFWRSPAYRSFTISERRFPKESGSFS